MTDLLELCDPPKGMVRKDDHATSKSAAVRVRRVTLRVRVIDMALAAGWRGITDGDLKAAHSKTPESSVRKRRTELAQENVLLETGFTRMNQHSQQEKVWVHRDFHPSPPPVIERKQEISKAEQIRRLESRVRDLTDMVVSALPYVEAGWTDQFSEHGKARVRALVDRMRKATEESEA